jgi:outer membrane protein
MFCVLILYLFRKGSPFLNQFSDNKGQSFGAQISIPVFNGFSVRNNVERSKVLERSKIALEQQDLDLKKCLCCIYRCKGALNAHESAIVALESRQEAYNYKRKI